jgi:DNA gyrase subunit A
VQGRGGLGIKVAKLAEERGDLIGALVVQEEDEVLVVMGGGKVVRSAVAGVPAKGRDTMGVIFAKPDKSDRIIAVARNSERSVAVEEGLIDDPGEASPDVDVMDTVTPVEEPADPTTDEVRLSTEETTEPDAGSPEHGGSE